MLLPPEPRFRENHDCARPDLFYLFYQVEIR
jgi:hypothetical protein